MTEGRTRLYAGIFVALGIAALIGLSIWLGKQRSTSQGHLFVTFFDESVQGLSKDSSVKYRGVLVGRV
ncbi:MAG: MlaD family protein, partial [Desulfatiglandales bacterium]